MAYALALTSRKEELQDLHAFCFHSGVEEQIEDNEEYTPTELPEGYDPEHVSAEKADGRDDPLPDCSSSRSKRNSPWGSPKLPARSAVQERKKTR